VAGFQALADIAIVFGIIAIRNSIDNLTDVLETRFLDIGTTLDDMKSNMEK
jgi:hypothetical protein